jgi:hypothetical protein
VAQPRVPEHRQGTPRSALPTDLDRRIDDVVSDLGAAAAANCPEATAEERTLFGLSNRWRPHDRGRATRREARTRGYQQGPGLPRPAGVGASGRAIGGKGGDRAD